MKEYTVEPNKDASAWFVKIEGVGLLEQHDKLDKAIEAGERVAQEDKPSTLKIMTKDKEVEETRTYKE